MRHPPRSQALSPLPHFKGGKRERESLGARLMHHTELSDPVTKRVMSHPSDHVTSTNCRTRAIVGE